MNTAEPIVVTVWNRASVGSSRKEDAFLGLVYIHVNEVDSLREPRALELLKRSTNSHVSGSVLIEMQPIDRSNITHPVLFSCVPNDQTGNFYLLLSRLFASEMKPCFNKFSSHALNLIQKLVEMWHINETFLVIR